MLSQKFVAVDSSKHHIKKFDCGKAGMNQFLSRFAVKHAKLGLSRTMVLTVENKTIEEVNKKQIAAYYTIAASTVVQKGIPTNKSLPKYPIPVVLLARLAVDVNFQGKYLGGKTLVYALRHIVRLCDKGLPAYGLVLDVLDDDALSFYQKFDFFHAFTDNPMRLFVPMSVLRML